MLFLAADDDNPLCFCCQQALLLCLDRGALGPLQADSIELWIARAVARDQPAGHVRDLG